MANINDFKATLKGGGARGGRSGGKSGGENGGRNDCEGDGAKAESRWQGVLIRQSTGHGCLALFLLGTPIVHDTH